MAPLNEKTIFLADGFGACTSALLLGLALPAVQEWIGMPTGVLYVLAGIAALFALNAFSGYRFAGERASRWLRLVVAGNLLYCVLTGSLVAIHLAGLTAWGVAYFAAEILIILGLVLVELKVLRSLGRSRLATRSGSPPVGPQPPV